MRVQISTEYEYEVSRNRTLELLPIIGLRCTLLLFRRHAVDDDPTGATHVGGVLRTALPDIGRLQQHAPFGGQKA